MKSRSFADLYREAGQHDDHQTASCVYDASKALARRMEEQERAADGHHPLADPLPRPSRGAWRSKA